MYHFQQFEKIHRITRGCVISEKIDGTNAQVFIPPDSSCVVAGSRNRWITPEDDNYGFAKWVKDNESELIKLGPGHHFGEWWGAGIQRRYGLAEKRFSLFEAGRWSNERPACCHVVPVLYGGVFTSEAIDTCLGTLREKGSVAAPGFMDPEGVVVWMSDARKRFKKTFDDAHKGAK